MPRPGADDDNRPWTPAGAPSGEVDVPGVVRAVAASADVRCVWRNQLGGLTFALDEARRFLKWAPAGSVLPLAAEAERMRWLHPYTPVPEVVDAGTGDDGSSWLLTIALPGVTAVADRWRADPRRAVRSIGAGLRAFHDRVPVSECPFGWSTRSRLAGIRRRADDNSIDPASWHPDHRGLTVDDALDVLADPPPDDRLVVCHGDACAPNTLIDDDGRWTGHVDLGTVGIADRWADLAVATWSTRWNYGPGWETELLAAYGIAPDPDRTRYYRLLWDLGD